MYGRQVNGQTTTFGTTGYTYNNLFLLYDRLTKSVWYPMKDGGIDGIGGSQLNQRITFLEEPPVITLGEWRSQHPDTLVLLDDAASVVE